MNIELKVGDKVKVMRQIGKHGIPTETNGEIVCFTNGITVGGKKTAIVQYDGGKDSYVYPIDNIILIENQKAT